MRRFSVIALALSFLAGGSGLADTAQIRVLSYNLGLLQLGGEDYVPDVAKRSAAAPKIVTALATAKQIDVLMLQEVWKEAVAKSLIKELESAGYSIFRSGPEEDFFKLGTGILMAFQKKTLPLGEKSARAIPFKSKGFADSFTHKGFAAATVSVVGKKDLQFEAITSHLLVL